MKLFVCLISLMLVLGNSFGANQWRQGTGENTILGTENASDIDEASYENIVSPLDRLLANYQQGSQLEYLSASTLTVTAGEVVLSNSAGTIRLMQRNAAGTTVSWSDIDTGAEAASTTYYIWAYQATVGDADFDIAISTSSTAPSGKTYYARLGHFYNDSSSNITKVTNDIVNVDWRVYDSGWFAVAINSAYTKTHSLGTIKVLATLAVADNSDGTGNLVLTLGGQDSDGSTSRGTAITDLTTTQVEISTAGQNLYRINTSGGVLSPTSGYARVILVALE